MICPACAHENREEARFCEQCGGPLASTCARCGNALRPASRFCDGYGAPAATGAAPGTGRSLDAERRPVTVLFSDLADSTPLAERNTVVISDATHQLVRGFFECRDLGPQHLKGLSAPLRVHEVRAATEAQSRVEAALGGGLTPLIGRDEEVDVLLARWRRAAAGSGQVVMVSGEAGIGKSRLLQELKERIDDGLGVRIECRCAPHREHSALYPIIDMLATSTDMTSRKRRPKTCSVVPGKTARAAKVLASRSDGPEPAAASG